MQKYVVWLLLCKSLVICHQNYLLIYNHANYNLVWFKKLVCTDLLHIPQLLKLTVLFEDCRL